MKPPALKPGDTVGVMAPSSYVDLDDLEKAARTLSSYGLRTHLHNQATARHHQFAGTDAEKVAALRDLFLNPAIKAVIAAGGGNGALHILDKIDYGVIRDNPKIVMGFSDCTALLNAITARTELVTFHGPIFRRLPQYRQLEDTVDLLMGHTPPYPFEKARPLREGQAQGPLVGGNLSVFQYLVGTADCPDLDGALLFLEDINEELSRVDRALCHLRRYGVFERIGGLILGEFSFMKDTGRPFGLTFEEIVLEHAGDRAIPIVANAPFGHGDLLYTFPIGAFARLRAAGNAAAFALRESPVD